MGAGRTNNPPIEITVPVSDSIDITATHTRSSSGTEWGLASSTNVIIYSIELPVGSRITAWTHNINKASAGTQTHTGRLFKRDISGVETGVGNNITNNQNAPGVTVLADNGISVDILDGFQYYYKFTPAAGGAGDVARHLDLFYKMVIT